MSGGNERDLAMELPFELRGLPGHIDVSVEPNRDPLALGCHAGATDFPVCLASITYAGRGYLSALGWVQMVRSTDGASGGREFEMDPYEPLGPLPHPFCWLGFSPILFDAPSRRARDPIDWLAHSFLCFIDGAHPRRQIRAILGFSWGFEITSSAITFKALEPLASHEWDAHLTLLRSEHPTWDFASGYRDR